MYFFNLFYLYLHYYMSLKSCNIIYGYLDNCLDLYQDSPNDYVLLIEPRGDIIDKLKKNIKTSHTVEVPSRISTSSVKVPSRLPKNIILISKMLSEKDKMTETILYFNKEEEKYFTKNESLLIRGTSYFNIKKYNVFTTSINNLIVQYNIQNINSLSININVQNCNEILDSVISFNHIISNISIHPTVNFLSDNCKILENFYKKNNFIYSHKNLNLKLPNIGMFINGKLKNNKEISLLIQQYKMNLIITKKKDSHIIPYPESITILNNNIYNIHSKIYHENIIQNLECIFNIGKNKNVYENNENVYENNENVYENNENVNENIKFISFDNNNQNENNQNNQNTEISVDNYNKVEVGDLEIIIQFNPKYFDDNKTLQIMYPLKDNILYVNKLFDIIYGTKNCIYMLYQIIKSKYFSDFLELKRSSKPKLFTIFSKIYFFEYISKIFIVKEF